MRVLVACEFSGTVRDAFRARGHDAYSCDLSYGHDLFSQEKAQFHFAGDVRPIMLDYEWDLMIAHPPCTHLAVSGSRWFKYKQKEQAEGVAFFLEMANSAIPRTCLENPVSIMSSIYRKPDQIIQPWQYGHGETKATCLWLKNLPPLTPTNIVDGRDPRVWAMFPSPDRWQLRSRTYQGIADAMAEQWGGLGPFAPVEAVP
jgi:hypothetical protein